MECVELAPAVGCVARFESGSKLHALHTLRAVWFRVCRPGDRRALPAVDDRLRPAEIREIAKTRKEKESKIDNKRAQHKIVPFCGNFLLFFGSRIAPQP